MICKLSRSCSNTKHFIAMNENKPIISIIVPVYNMEKYIDRCLRNLLKEEYNSFIEIICINDGSTDNSLKILKSYDKKFSNLFVSSQPNKGLGATRNEGIRKANGKYLMFIDSDDCILPNSLDELIKFAKHSSCDFVEFESEVFFDDGRYSHKFNEIGKELIDSDMNEYLIYNKKLLITAWSKLWNTDFIRSNKIEFQENVLFEDIEFSMTAYQHCKVISGMKLPVYCYFLNSGSLTRSRISDKFLKEFFDQRILLNYKWKESIDNVLISELLEKEIKRAKRRFFIYVFHGIIRNSISYKWFSKFWFVLKL